MLTPGAQTILTWVFRLVGLFLLAVGVITGVGVTICAGVIFFGMPVVALAGKSNPSDPSLARLRKIHDRASVNGPEWWDNTEKRWIGQAERDSWVAGDPYAARITVEQAFGNDPLAEHAQTIQGLRTQHAMGILTSEQLTDCIDNIEQVAEVAGDRRLQCGCSEKHPNPKCRHVKAYKRPPRKGPESESIRRAREVFGTASHKTLTQINQDLKALERKADKTLREVERGEADLRVTRDVFESMRRKLSATDAPGQIVTLAEGSKPEFVLHPKAAHCESCASVYTDQSNEPVARYCDGSCNR